MTNPAKTAGPNADGSHALASESKAGVITTGLVFFVLQTLAQGLGTLDTSRWQGWWVPVVTGGVASVTGLITAYLKKNRSR
jgi:hypothetical protein